MTAPTTAASVPGDPDRAAVIRALVRAYAYTPEFAEKYFDSHFAARTQSAQPSGMAGDSLALALRFHEAYERLAPSFGYETRTDTRAFDPESKNGKLMIAACAELSTAPPIAQQGGELSDSAIRAVCEEMRDCKVNHGKAHSPTLIAWAERIEAALASKADGGESAGIPGYGGVPIDPDDPELRAW